MAPLRGLGIERGVTVHRCRAAACPPNPGPNRPHSRRIPPRGDSAGRSHGLAARTGGLPVARPRGTEQRACGRGFDADAVRHVAPPDAPEHRRPCRRGADRPGARRRGRGAPAGVLDVQLRRRVVAAHQVLAAPLGRASTSRPRRRPASPVGPSRGDVTGSTRRVGVATRYRWSTRTSASTPGAPCTPSSVR